MNSSFFVIFLDILHVSCKQVKVKNKRMADEYKIEKKNIKRGEREKRKTAKRRKEKKKRKIKERRKQNG